MTPWTPSPTAWGGEVKAPLWTGGLGGGLKCKGPGGM